MHIFTSSNHLAPKSILRHRPLDPDIKPTEPPRVPRASLTRTQKPKANTTISVDIPVWKVDVPIWKSVQKSSTFRRQHLLLFSIAAEIFLAVVLVFVGQLFVGWIETMRDDLQYGRPRTYQVDAVVGPNDSLAHPSHFIALNQQGQIEVIEFPAGDAAHVKIYLGPHLYGPNADLVPVTLQFVNGQNSHIKDMVMIFQGTRMLFHNVGDTSHAPTTSP